MSINVKYYPNKIDVGLKGCMDFEKFYYVFTHEKKKYRETIDFGGRGWNKRTRVEQAKQWLSKAKNAKLDGVGDGRVSLDAYFYEFYELREESSWNRTLKSHYERYVSPSIGKKQISKVTNDHIKQSIKVQRDLGLKPRTVKQTIEALAPVFKNAVNNRLITFNPMDGVEIKRPNTKKMVTNAKSELKRIYEAICLEFYEDAFYKAFYLFALHGRRKGEIMGMLWEDVSFEESYYIIRDTKNGEEQKMYLDAEINKLLFSFYDESDKYVFTSGRTSSHIVNVEKTTKRLKKRLGDGFTLHYLRNVLVSALGEDGTKSTFMSGALGHNNTHTLSKYLSLNYLESSEVASVTIKSIVN